MEALSTAPSFSYYWAGDHYAFTCYGSDANTFSKGWRSIGCFSCDEKSFYPNIHALERSGCILETRSSRDMANAVRRAA